MDFNKPIISHTGTAVPQAKFSILIPSWNNIELLKVCVNSILKNSVEQHQIIIHVNEGTDGSLDWVKQNNFSYTKSDENVGVCYAMNAMAKLATTDYILYMNDDMYACPNWDSYLIEAIDNQKDELFYFSATMIEPTSSNNKCVIAPHHFGLTAETFEEEKLLTFTQTAKKEDWYGASWPPSIVHKSLWNKVGGYSEEYSPGFGSDPDFSRKLWGAGVRNFKGIGKSMVYHFQSKSTGRVVRNNGRLTFATKWGIPSSYFYKNILRLGEPFKNEALVAPKDIAYRIAQVRAFWIALKK